MSGLNQCARNAQGLTAPTGSNPVPSAIGELAESGLLHTIGSRAGASKPLGGSNPPLSAKFNRVWPKRNGTSLGNWNIM